MTFYLNQPNNLLINHLGKGTWWETFSAAQLKLSYLSPFMVTHFSKLLRILLISGTFFQNHFFFNNKFFKNFSKYQFPIDFSKNLFIKFYREVRLKITINQGGKKIYYIRKMFQTLNISELSFFKKSFNILITLNIHLPSPYKRTFKNYLIKNFNKKNFIIINRYLLTTLFFNKYRIKF